MILFTWIRSQVRQAIIDGYNDAFADLESGAGLSPRLRSVIERDGGARPPEVNPAPVYTAPTMVDATGALAGSVNGKAKRKVGV